MKPIVLDSIPVTLSAAEIAPQLRVKEGTEDYEALEALLRQACAIARPKAIYTMASITGHGDGYVEIEGVRMESRVMCDNLKGVHRAFPYVATCGTEVDKWSAGVADFLENWWMDVAKEHLLGRAIRQLNGHLKQTYGIERMSNMNPGSLPDWPITAQPQLFGLLGDVAASIGVTLTDSMLMVPSKSVSGLYFQNESNYENCELCDRKDCPGRRKPFDKEKHETILGPE